MKTTGLRKKHLLYIGVGVILIIALLVLIGLFFYFSNKAQKNTQTYNAMSEQEKIIRSLSAPEGVSDTISQGVIKNLSTPSENQKQVKISENILKSLSAPK